MEGKQGTTDSSSGSSLEPLGGGREISELSKQIAKVVDILTESYRGHSYKEEKKKTPDLPGLWRWVNATFGSFTLAFAASLFQLSSPGQKGIASLSRLSVLFGWSQESTSILLSLSFFLTGCMLIGAVVATSTKSGGPMRLFIMGVLLLSLPLIMAARAG